MPIALYIGGLVAVDALDVLVPFVVFALAYIRFAANNACPACSMFAIERRKSAREERV